MNRKLRMGMIGGGTGAFIGAVHRMAAALDGEAELVCGAFSSTPERSRQSGAELGLVSDRVYGTFEEMIAAEKNRPDRMDFVSVVTPNHMHYPAARKTLEAGFPVICDKPMTRSLAEAKELAAVVERTGLLFGLTHNYTGYPMVKEAREMVRNDRIGVVRKVIVEYPQGWLATKLEDTGHKQASWRADPAKTGAANCMGDIGTHAENLAEYITGLKIAELCADLTTFVPGRVLEDDGNVLIRFDSGAKGVLMASQISIGEENGLAIRIHGDRGSLYWRQEEPNTLIARWPDRPTEILRTAASYLSPRAAYNTRLPMGHPEGFIEAFANIYRNYIRALKAILDGRPPAPENLDFPTVRDGVRGMAFIETVVASSKSDTKWTAFKQ